MNNYKIITFAQCLDKKRLINQIKDIFFESSSKKDFNDQNHKDEFFRKWCGNYLENYPETFYLCINDNEELLGYLSCVFNTLESLEFFDYPGQKVFVDLYECFHAHLHINFSELSRGLGLGSILVNYVINLLKEKKINGLHLITTPDAKNVSFYSRLGFTHEEVRSHNGYELLFMGIDL